MEATPSSYATGIRAYRDGKWVAAVAALQEHRALVLDNKSTIPPKDDLHLYYLMMTGEALNDEAQAADCMKARGFNPYTQLWAAWRKTHGAAPPNDKTSLRSPA
jgi:hypothetical protein